MSEHKGAMLIDGHENAFVGFGNQALSESVAVYSMLRILANLQEMGMSGDEALEFFEFNIAGAWVGDRTPIIIDDVHSPTKLKEK
tara:strand:+ start:522 stop:776 length:255 start_codon:yes stop_codon:yes gene_type:complete